MSDSELSAFLAKNCFQAAQCRFCGEEITFKDRVAYDINGQHEHRCITQRLKFECRHCSGAIYFKDRKPFNSLDGTPHRCLSQRRAPTESEQNYRDLIGFDGKDGAA